MEEENDPRRRLRRRGFLIAGASGAVAAGAFLAARDSGDEPRAQVAGDGYVNLATFLLAAHPPKVRDAIERHRRGLDANAALYLREHEEELEHAARAAAAEHLAAEADDVALTDSTTMGLALVYGGLRLEPGDEVVTTAHDFYATHEALRLRAERARAAHPGGRADVGALVERREAAAARDRGGRV
jgi:selenocysteine lyase/cysteine desulfurase